MGDQICQVCGKCVHLGSGNFVNRVTDFDDIETRKERGVKFPLGDFICAQCEEVNNLRSEIANLQEEKIKLVYLLNEATDICCPGKIKNCIWKEYCNVPDMACSH